MPLLSEYQNLKMLEKSNIHREQRLSHVRQKNFRRKEAELSAELSKLHSEAARKMAELEEVRCHFVTEMCRRVFPIEVESLSERDAGEGVYSTACTGILVVSQVFYESKFVESLIG